MSFNFVGVDIETTGSNQDDKVIQIGVAYSPIDIFVSDVYPLGAWELNKEAAEVNKFTQERINSAPLANVVDEILYSWLASRFSKSRHDNIAVGWNVGAFDMYHVRKDLPKSASLFSYRVVDLNSLIFAKVHTQNGFKKIKHEAKQYAASLLKTQNWHDAKYDAVASLLSFEYLQNVHKFDIV